MEEKIFNFKELRVWQLAIEFVDRVYDITSHFPDGQRNVLAKQLIRCSISVASNIAEGSLRGSKKEFARFVSIARGSLAEAETQIVIGGKRNFIVPKDKNELEEMVISLHKMLTKLYKSLLT